MMRTTLIRDGVVREEESTLFHGDPYTRIRYILPNGYIVSVLYKNGERHDYSVTVRTAEPDEPHIPTGRIQSAFAHCGILPDGILFGRATWQQVEAFIDRVRGW